MALTHSSALRLTKHQRSGRGGRERERKVPPLALANNMELWKAGGVCARVFALRVREVLHVFDLCTTGLHWCGSRVLTE